MMELNKENREEYIGSVRNALKAQNITEFRPLFVELHPTDQLEFFLSLSMQQRERLYQYVSPAEFAELFQGMELDQQKEYINELDQRFAVEMFNSMYSDDVADFLGELPDSTAEKFLNKMSKAEAQDVIQLLAYPEETAGALMATEFISISVHDTVADVMNLLRAEGPAAEIIYYLYVIDRQNRLVGVASLRDLIVSSPEQLVEEVMSTQVVSVSALADQEEVAHLIQRYDFLAVPVVNKQEQFVGIITVDDIMDVVEQETTEDIGEISAARGAVELDVTSFGAAKKRTPWILILMFLGLITASVISRFEETLEEVALLAFFMPLIMGSAGNAGTQSLAVVVRGLALGTLERAGVAHLLRRELGTGLMLGFVCGIILFMFIPILFSWMLGLVIGFSLLATLSVATIVGSIIPLIINKLNIDPAVASGPFITTIIDIIAVMIYFSIATALLSYL